RLLVDLEADAVPGAVYERVAPARRGDHLATRMIDRRAVGTRAHRLTTRPLALAHDVPHMSRVGPRVADAHGAGTVGAVAVDDTTEVDDDKCARLDVAHARARVRFGRVRTRCDDRIEAVAARTAPSHLDFELQGEIAFGWPLREPGQEGA